MKKSSLKRFSSILLWTYLCVASVAIQAQQIDRTTVTVNTDLVVTWAQAVNRIDGSPIKGLGIDDFLLREDGKQQQLSLVKEGRPLSVVILVDAMQCVWPPEIELRRSRAALRQLGEDAEIALMIWDSEVRLVQPLTVDQPSIANRLENRISFFYTLNGAQSDSYIKVRPERDNHRPGEAVYQAARYLEKAASPGRRKIIIVITQSYLAMARTHTHTGSEVKELLRKTGTTVYALLENNGIRSVYGADEYNPVTMFQVMRKKRQRRSGGILEEFVDLTGGSILMSKNEPWLNLSTLTPNAAFGKEFDELFIKLTELIRSSYTIGYYPENTNFDGRFRRIQLELSPSGKTKVGKVSIKSREGYQAMRHLPLKAVN